ncbi:MAG: ribonuclease III [Clostridia bacterium]|nr:ribonuclease III [Clostridia bacterium]
MSLEELQNRIGYRFRSPAYLEQALTHSSYSNETESRDHHLKCNERLEFLGDSILSLAASEYLYKQFGRAPEGDLTRMRAASVCEEALASYAETFDLGAFLRLGKGETQSGGAKKPAILADAFEALLAAMYLDAGDDGFEVVKTFVLPFIRARVETLPMTKGADCKSLLQQFVQQDKEEHRLEYRLTGESGPDHNKTFMVEVFLDSNRIGSGEGHTKKQAEQMAADAALSLFGVEH